MKTDKRQLIDAAIVITAITYGVTPQQIIARNNSRKGEAIRTVHNARKIIFMILRDNLQLDVKKIADIMERKYPNVVMQLAKLDIQDGDDRDLAKMAIDKFNTYYQKFAA